MKKSPIQSKTDRLVALFHDEIRDNRYCLRERLPSERELTARYNVSRITVRRALARLEKDGIIARRQGAGVYLKRKTEPRGQDAPAPIKVRVGFVFRFHRCNSPAFAELLETFKESLHADIQVAVYFHDVLAPAVYQQAGLDLLIVDAWFSEDDVLDLERLGFAVIMYNRVPEHGNYVCSNNFMGGCLMMDFLASKGHRRIVVYPALATNRLPGDEMAERLRGMRKMAVRHGLQTIPIRPETQDPRGIHHAVQELLRRKTEFTAVAALTDFAALEFATELEAGDVQVPKAVSVIGYDDRWFAAMLPTRLTTIRPPVAEMARFLARVVNELPQGSKLRIRRQFAPLLIERASVSDISRPRVSATGRSND